MINITKNIQLREIKEKDCNVLYKLMKIIYPLAYQHFWKDKGDWYIKNQYSEENILKELSKKNAAYYFVIFKNEIIGNFRIVWDKKLENLPYKKQVKLHRIYLHGKTQGKGIGKTLLIWLEKEAIKKQYELIWLDAMNEKQQAFEFYKKQGYKYNSHSFLNFDFLYKDFRKMSQLYKIIC